jgi:hypothetical protein
VKSWIRIRINVKTEKLQMLKIEPNWTLNGGQEAHFGEEQDPGLGLGIMDPAIFVIDLKDVNKIFSFKFSACYILKLHLHNFSKMNSHKEVTNQ